MNAYSRASCSKSTLEISISNSRQWCENHNLRITIPIMLFDYLDYYWLKVPDVMQYSYMSVCIHISLLHTHTYVYVCICICIYTYVYVHVCLYIYKTKPRADINHTQVWIINPSLLTITVRVETSEFLEPQFPHLQQGLTPILKLTQMHRIVQYLAWHTAGTRWILYVILRNA